MHVHVVYWYLAGSQSSSYFCCQAYQHSSLGPHNPSRSAKPSRRLHWNSPAILIEVHCTSIVVSGTKLKTLNASCRPQMAYQYTTCLTSFPCIKTSPSAHHCPRSLSAVYSSSSKHLGAKHANTPTLGQAISPLILSSPASSQPTIWFSPRCIATTTKQLVPVKCLPLNFELGTQLLLYIYVSSQRSGSPSTLQCPDEIHAHQVEQPRITDRIRHHYHRKNGQNTRKGQEDLLSAQEHRAGIEQRFFG